VLRVREMRQLREFGRLESAIMEVMWSQDRPLLVREVLVRLRYPRPVAYTTVMTVMTILYGKGVLCRDKHGKAWRYWPAEPRPDHDARLMAEILRAADDQPLTLDRFLDQMGQQDLELIRTLLDQRVPRAAAS
jgi:predicted transcriptional regulator